MTRRRRGDEVVRIASIERLRTGVSMPTVVEQIQLEAVSSETPVSQLLRRVKLAAVKLKLKTVAAWVDHEIDGYGDAPVPDYRIVAGAPVAHNPYNGWIPIQTSVEQMDSLRRLKIRQSIASLEALIPGDGTIYFQYSPAMIDWINSGVDIPFARMGVQLDRSAIIGLLDRVRGKVLEWALELELAGITGEGVSFTNQEVERALSMALQIENFTGTLNTGVANGPNARINNNSTDNSTNIVQEHEKKFDELKSALQGIADQGRRQEISTQVDELKAAEGTSRFLDVYQKFVSSASDHITVIAPFLPWLGTLLAAAGS
ncbi:MAG: hypothetical protein B7Z44_15845 [Caulobacter sp. 12-67-6]|nr:MAG: hypothetical protein B7Z44_15845 [Caulobacter sp. 12-67-6]